MFDTTTKTNTKTTKSWKFSKTIKRLGPES
jgi:hypothetical protein